MSWVLHTKNKQAVVKSSPVTVGVYPQKNTSMVLLTLPQEVAAPLGLSVGSPFNVYLEKKNGVMTGRFRVSAFDGDPKDAERYARSSGKKVQLAFSVPERISFIPAVSTEPKAVDKSLQFDLDKVRHASTGAPPKKKAVPAKESNLKKVAAAYRAIIQAGG